MSRTDSANVLIIDDNEATCTLIAAILHREYQVEVVLDGSDGIDKLRTSNYAAVILDLRMPQVDGFGVLEFLRDHRPEILSRVVVVTAAINDRDLRRAQAFPIAAIIAKPFEVDTLLSAVRACTESGSTGLGKVLSGGMLFLLADLLRQRLM